MTTAYWAQFDHSEIMSMHGVELDNCHDDDDNDCYLSSETCEEEECCPRCSGGGCNYCLMLSW